MKTGVELEFWITDTDGKLSSAEELASRLEFAEKEFVEPVLEIKTRPHNGIDELQSEIRRKLSNGIEEAEDLGQKIVPLGTPLNSGKIETVDSPRSEIQQKIVGERLEYAKHVTGTHFHFEQTEPVKQLNLLTALDPALALSSSSPYYRGEKVAENARNHIYRHRCYKEFPEHGYLWNYTSSIDEWTKRIRDRFKQFYRAAEKQGIEKEELKKYFSPQDSVWIPVRLRKEFGTVEWRAPDSTLPRQLLELLDQVKKMVEKLEERDLETGEPGAGDDKITVPEFERLEKLSRDAIIRGCENSDVSNYLEKMGFKTEDFQPVTKQIDTGPHISLNKARHTRLKWAEKLKTDVKKL